MRPKGDAYWLGMLEQGLASMGLDVGMHEEERARACERENRPLGKPGIGSVQR